MDKAQIEKLAARLGELTLDQRKTILNSLRKIVPPPRLSRYNLKRRSIKQEALLQISDLEVMYGGAAGGGKSYGLIDAALQYADVGGYAALLLRNTFSELDKPGSLISISKSALATTDAVWREQKHRWEFPGGGVIQFGYCLNDDDKWRYQSDTYQFIGVDQIEEFALESTYQYFFSRLRRTEEMSIPLRIRTTANPIGAGAKWVKQRFVVNPNVDQQIEINGVVHRYRRLFVPAKLEDNPFMDKDSYILSLNQLDPYTRQALLDGDWDAKPPGKMFRREWFKRLRASPTDALWVRFWDLAATPEDKNNNPSWSCGVKMGYDAGRFVVGDVRRVRATPGEVKTLVKATAIEDGPEVEVYIEEEGGNSGKFEIEEYVRFMPRFVVRGWRPTGPKETRAKPFASQAQNGNVWLREAPWNEDYVSEFEQFPPNTNKIKTDQVDASSGAYAILAEEAEDEDRLAAGDLYAGGELPIPDWD